CLIDLATVVSISPGSAWALIPLEPIQANTAVPAAAATATSTAPAISTTFTRDIIFSGSPDMPPDFSQRRHDPPRSRSNTPSLDKSPWAHSPGRSSPRTPDRSLVPQLRPADAARRKAAEHAPPRPRPYDRHVRRPLRRCAPRARQPQ